MVRFGFGLLGVHPAGDLVDLVRTADELGFHSCYLPDDPSMRDSWAVVAAAARRDLLDPARVQRDPCEPARSRPHRTGAGDT